jgi:hypothetical protein
VPVAEEEAQLLPETVVRVEMVVRGKIGILHMVWVEVAAVAVKTAVLLQLE